MKKLFILAIAFLFVMLPFTSFTKDVITDSDLDQVTAESGVSIGFSNFALGGSAVAGTVTLLGDSNGYNDGTYIYPGRGFTGASNIAISGNIMQIGGNVVIDVGTSGTSTAVNISLPTITLGTADVSGVMQLNSTVNLTTGRKLGELGIVGLSTQVAAQSIQIFAH